MVNPPTQPPVPSQPPQPASYTQYQAAVTQKEDKPISWKTGLKILYLLGFASLIFVLIFWGVRKVTSKAKLSMVPGEILLQTRYKSVLWRDFGEVFEPIIEIPLVYPNGKSKKQEFLLDSGAVVSSLPREMVGRLGFSLAKLPRSTFAGFGGTTSFAYKASIKISMNEQEFTIPVVFTEAAGTKAIIGRSGFFENFSVYFNAEEEIIEIRK